MKRIIGILLLCALSLSCSEKQGRALIGISCGRTASGTDQLSHFYSEAIARAGGVPVIIPTVHTPVEAAAVLEKLDGVVFSGGEDINPAWYGETILNETVDINHVRDLSDSLLASCSIRLDKPVLAICRGGQLLNVILGGSLYQDIPSQLPEAHTHRGISHKIGPEKGTFLWTLFGPDSLLVNSRHHQAVKELAPGAALAARSDDGIIEAFEKGRVWAVQFHPEGMVDEDARWLTLFKAFLDRTN